MRKKILVIEDEADLSRTLTIFFQKEGFEVVSASDGMDGLDKARQYRPDIVILDLVLPKLCGEEVCKEIRKDQALGGTPIIMLTAKSKDVDTIIGKVIGADAYMVKPYDINKLLEEVNRLITQEYSPLRQEAVSGLKERLLVLLKEKAFKKGRFTLSSGKTSNYYLDGRIITLSAQGAFLAASIILELLKDKSVDAVGGPTIGADPIVGALAALSYVNQAPVNTFIVRKSAKEHGAGRQIEGPALKTGDRVILVDDVATTGKALIEAKQALEKIGVSVERAIVIVDRSEGARENLAKAGLKLESIFSIEDFGP